MKCYVKSVSVCNRWNEVILQMQKVFQPINSIIEPSFWHTLAQKKINDKMLDETPFGVSAFFQAGKYASVSSYAFVNQDSFSQEKSNSTATHFLQYTASFPLQIHLLNTKNTFQSLDRTSILKSLGSSIYDSIASKQWLENPSLLLQSALTIFGDLKKWHFIYCFAFPTPSIGGISLSDSAEFTDEISEFPNWLFALNNEGKVIPLKEATGESTFVIIDPSTSDLLGWPAQIASYAISQTYNVQQFKLIRLNYKPMKFTVNVTEHLSPETKFIGWKLNNKKPFFVDLSSTMDPMALFTSASTLNLRLMKWRMAPQLDVDKIQKQKVLLIGCGTLGCNVARDLLGWGVRNFSLIDYGKVSFSNPPRQPLFCFEDCLNGGKQKSLAAAEELKRICPDVTAEHFEIEIPMPGHPCMGPESSEKLKATIDKLDSLIQKNDVTFLLTDTRESRWLPTVICAARGKLCISIALGYDSFSVVRSGSRHVGCYFCNDVIAPVDTMSNRTLDMQCTVTRPGIAPLASSIGVELWAAITQHKDGKDAHGDGESILGQVPHQILGFLNNWQIMPLQGERFTHCVGCSDPIIQGYLNDGSKFIERAINEPDFLENVSGITAMKASLVDEECEWDDDI